ncbi:MAG: hypothetical protein V1799_07710 [bacterium]
MIEKDEIPLDAVSPTEVERKFLERLVRETTEYARSKNHSDLYFQGHSDQGYFGAYSTKIIRRGAGRFVFGFDWRAGKLRMAVPIGISEPYRLAKSWTGDPSRNRAVIDIDDDLTEEMHLYFIEMGRRSIVFHYNK